MIRPIAALSLAFLIAWTATPAMAVPAGSPSDGPALWAVWRNHFVEPSGRVVDNANGGISHSEGQGYGMLLAVLSDDEATFRLIWNFTRTELFIVGKDLPAWRWDAATNPHIQDTNNATDGDILIAYALTLAGRAWDDDGLIDSARTMAEAIGRKTVVAAPGRRLILPGADGFSAEERPDGPVVNLSYWVFEALPVLAELDPTTDWQAVAATGLELAQNARFGPADLPPEWLSIGHGRLRPAQGFDAVFGYNAIRIPLYLMRAGLATPNRLAPFLANRNGDGSSNVVLLANGAKIEPLADQGYRMVLAAAECATSGVPLPSDLADYNATLYYPATLYLLAWFYLAEAVPGCL